MLKKEYLEFMEKSTDKVVAWTEFYDTCGICCADYYCSMSVFDPDMLVRPEHIPYFEVYHLRIINKNEVPPAHYRDEYYGWDAPETYEQDPVFYY